jgi:hypothetical protein
MNHIPEARRLADSVADISPVLPLHEFRARQRAEQKARRAERRRKRRARLARLLGQLMRTATLVATPSSAATGTRLL